MEHDGDIRHFETKLHIPNQARLAQQIGSGTAGFLMPPLSGNITHKISNHIMIMAMRDRILGTPTQILGEDRGIHCTNCNKCGEALHDPVRHALNCLKDRWRK